jgi:predicted nucleotidyltransferase
LSLFGSVLKEDFTRESDVDVLGEFELGKTPILAIIAAGGRRSENLYQNLILAI